RHARADAALRLELLGRRLLELPVAGLRDRPRRGRRVDRPVAGHRRLRGPPGVALPCAHRPRLPARRAGGGVVRGTSLPPLAGRGNASHRSASASLAPSAAKAPANVRRIQVSTAGREMTWLRIEAANRP